MRRLTLFVLAGCLLLGLAARGEAHPHKTTPPLNLIANIKGDHVLLKVLLHEALLHQWLGLKEGKPTDEQVLALVRRHATLEFDGQPLEMAFVRQHVIAGYEDPETKVVHPPVAYIELRLAHEAIPQQARFAWDLYDGIDWEGEVQVPLTIDAFVGREEFGFAATQLTPEESELLWNRSLPVAFQFKPLVVPPGEPPTRIPLPLLPVALVLAALLFLWRARGVAPVIRALPLVIALGVAWPLRDIGAASFTVPGTGTRVLPDEPKARAIFQQLQDNIYSAFRERDAEDVYDLLAASVEGPLVEPLYKQVYASLLMKEAGGVVTKVQDVEHLDGEVQFPPESWERYFDVTWHWKATGSFAHLGHVHTRINEYKARYRVRQAEGTWKIAEIEVLEHRRTDDDNPTELIDLATGIGVPESRGADDASATDAKR